MPIDAPASQPPDVLAVVSQLSTYLRTHPQSADTSEGIARWWFDAEPSPTAALVQAALQWMEAMGVVEAQHAADGRVRWRARQGLPDLDLRLAALAARPCGDTLPPGTDSGAVH
jgi:hypothetical protein